MTEEQKFRTHEITRIRFSEELSKVEVRISMDPRAKGEPKRGASTADVRRFLEEEHPGLKVDAVLEHCVVSNYRPTRMNGTWKFAVISQEPDAEASEVFGIKEGDVEPEVAPVSKKKKKKPKKKSDSSSLTDVKD